MTPPNMFFAPGNGPRSSKQTVRPARASASAALDPAGPAPTTTASKRSGMGRLLLEADAQLRHNGAGVSDDREVGHLHHRATRIEVDRDDVSGLAEAGDVLNGARDPQRDIELGIDRHAG